MSIYEILMVVLTVARLVFDIFADGLYADVITANRLIVYSKAGTAWTTFGPKYLAPVFEFVQHKSDGAETMTDGKYLIGRVVGITGNLNNIVVEGLEGLPFLLRPDMVPVKAQELRKAGVPSGTGELHLVQGAHFVEFQEFVIGLHLWLPVFRRKDSFLLNLQDRSLVLSLPASVFNLLMDKFFHSIF